VRIIEKCAKTKTKIRDLRVSLLYGAYYLLLIPIYKYFSFHIVHFIAMTPS